MNILSMMNDTANNYKADNSFGMFERKNSLPSSVPPRNSHNATKAKNSSTSINRSESYRERIPQKKIREKRKTSDPNLSKTSDVDLDSQGLSYNTNSGSSSNSSLSVRSLDSPSAPLDMVTATQQRVQEAVTVTLTPNNIIPALGDSDTEAEPDPPDWTKGVDENVLKSLTSREKKRQEVINELFHTEKTHVTKLKVLDQIFLKPMQECQILPADQLQLLFQNLEEMLDIHSRFNTAMKAKKKESPLVGDISDILLAMFDGAEGDNFQRAAAVFCAKQQIALEQLKERRKKDAKLNNFLTEAEGNAMCKRLQLKDMLPTVMLRLTKYPLLFENLAKYSQGYPEEEKSILKAVERSKAILNHVNQAVKAAGDHQRLEEIQRRLDKSAFEKVDHPMTYEFKNLDLRTHKLIYEGSLSWRIGNRQKPIDIYVLLLHDIIILLQKQDEKFVLKFYNMNTSSLLSPIVKVSSVLVRHNAVDKTALYLVNTSQNNAQIYDLVASSPSERKKWLRHISEAADAYKNKDHFGKNRRLDLAVSSPQSPPDSENAEESSDKNKELEDSGHEAEAPNKSTGNDLETSGASQDGGESVPSNESSQNSAGATATPTPSTTPTTTTTTPQSSPLLSGQTDGGDQGKKSAESSPSHRTIIEQLRLSTVENSLIQPSEVVVSQKSVMTAEPVLTPLEQLRLKDEAIRRALSEKQQLVAEILHVPKGEFETIADIAAEPSIDKEATELILAAVNQANQLAAALNDSLRVTEEEAIAVTSEVHPGCSPRSGRRKSRLPGVPTHKLQGISVCLNSQLTQLLRIVKERDEERERLRRELQRSRELIHFLHEMHRKSPKSEAYYRLAEDAMQESGDLMPDTGMQVSSVAEDSTSNDLSQQNPEGREGKSDAGNEVFVDALSGDNDTLDIPSERSEDVREEEGREGEDEEEEAEAEDEEEEDEDEEVREKKKGGGGVASNDVP